MVRSRGFPDHPPQPGRVTKVRRQSGARDPITVASAEQDMPIGRQSGRPGAVGRWLSGALHAARSDDADTQTNPAVSALANTLGPLTASPAALTVHICAG